MKKKKTQFGLSTCDGNSNKKAAAKKTKKVKQVCCPSLLFCEQALVKFLLPGPRSRSLILSQSFSRSI